MNATEKEMGMMTLHLAATMLGRVDLGPLIAELEATNDELELELARAAAPLHALVMSERADLRMRRIISVESEPAEQEVLSPWAEELRGWAEGRDYATTAEALRSLGIEPSEATQFDMSRVGKALRALGFSVDGRMLASDGERLWQREGVASAPDAELEDAEDPGAEEGAQLARCPVCNLVRPMPCPDCAREEQEHAGESKLPTTPAGAQSPSS